MDNYKAIGLAEGFIESNDESEILAAWQHLHTTRLGYSLQGFFGRTLRHLIDSGLIQE
jgi:hypothetical protein